MRSSALGRLGTALALLVFSGGACSDAEVQLPPDAFSLGTGRFLVRVSAQGMELQRDGATVVSLDPQSFQIGVVQDLGANLSWDPWEIEQRGEAAAGVTFLAPATWAPGLDADGNAVLHLDYPGGLGADLAVAVASGSRFSFNLSPSPSPPGAPAIALTRVRVRTSGDPAEGFYGLGTQLDGVDNRGKLRALHLEVDQPTESKTNDVRAPVPLLIGTHGWGMFVASLRQGTFDVARKDPSVVEATFAATPVGGESAADTLRVDLFLDDAPIDLYREYFAATGGVRPPPPWALGPWVWRNTNTNQAEVEADMRALRDLDLAVSGIWINAPYETAVNTFAFDPARYPDPTALVAHAHGGGLRLALWSTPYLEKTVEPAFDQATANGFFPPKVGRLMNPWGPPIDFTSPDAAAFWRGLIQQLTTMGVDGFKLDWGADVVASLGAERNVWGFSDGSDERTMQYRFPGLYHRAYSDAATGRTPQAPLPNAPLPFLFVREARWGEASQGIVLAAGDLDATFTRQGESFTSREGPTVVGTGGLPTALAMSLSAGASGFSYFASDTGGYLHGPADKELFVRWLEASALSPVMEIGDATNQPPWAGRDADELGLFRTYARIHTQLFPYVWTHAQRMIVDGRPLVRPLGLAYPSLGAHPSDEYLLGDDLLVAPVVERGAVTRTLLVPPGTWFGFFDGEPLIGDAKSQAQVDAPPGLLPLFVREGALVPMLRRTIDTLSSATDPAVDSFERDPGPLWVLIAPGPPGAFALWDGSRVAREAAGVFSVADGSVFAQGFVLQILAGAPPSEVTREGVALARVESLDTLERDASGWTYATERRGTIYVKVPAGNARIDVR